MPPYGVRRECGENPKPVRAAASRPYDAPSTRSVGRGAHTPPKQAAGTTGLTGHVTRPWQHVGVPPYGVRRECGENPKPVRAAASRPYDAPSTRSVGRGAHTPPKQAAGTTGLTDHVTRPWRHVGMPPYEVGRGAVAIAGIFGRI